jgi:hypothetical protein
MLEPTIDYFQKILPGYQYLTELWYIDLALFKVDDDLLEKRKRSGIMCDPWRLHFLSYFEPGKWLTIKESGSHRSANATRLNLNLLYREGFLLRKKRGRSYVYCQNPDYVNPITDVVAIELKLKDYKAVHRQADSRRMYYADKSYAVLALKGAICEKVVQYFKRYNTGVGLLFAKPQIEMALEYEDKGWTPIHRQGACEEILRRTGVIPCLINSDTATPVTTSTPNASVTSASENDCFIHSGLTVSTGR